MATPGPSQPAPREEQQYIDFLLLGKTGMGKSTTADRLLTAQYTAQMVTPEPVVLEGGDKKIDDIIIWRLGNRSVDDVKARVKYFLFNCAFGYEAIDHQNKSVESVTRDCVLLSNEKTRIRVLDVPGFHTTFVPPGQQLGTNEIAHSDNLGIMRQILRIQAQKNLHFRRILYFLPCRGPMEKADATFQDELRIMNHFFGRMIFDSMVVIATVQRRKSKLNEFTDEDSQETRSVLNKAFELTLGGDPLPQPPIFYISLEERSSEMFSRLQHTPVKSFVGLELHLDPNTCARCALKFGVYRTETVEKRVVSLNVVDGRNVWSAYDESTCHPLIKPKYSTLQKVVGGIAYILLLGIPLLVGSPFPWFFNHDEECAVCKHPPGPPGCRKVGQECEVKAQEGKITIKVDHTSELDRIVIQP